MIYIENGSNYHTYTFTITRDNALPTDPVENLVLSPLTDGTYRELLFTYSLTPAEKQNLLNGLPVDPENNITVTELTHGIYNNGQLQKNTCGWSPSTIWTECSAGEHGEWNIGEWHNCKAEVPPKAYVAMTYSCSSELPPTGGGPGGSGDGGSSGGGSGDDGEAPLCNENGVLTDPQPPLFLNPDVCSGIPTQPNIPNPNNNPCEKTKASITAADNLLQNPTVQTQMDAVLKGKRTLENEWNTAIGLNNDGSYDITPAIEQQQNSGSSPDDLLSNPASFFADGHTHSGDPAKPSAGDLYGMLNEVFYNANFKYRYVYGDSDMGTPEVYALVLNDRAAAIQFRGTYLESENYDIDKHGFKEGSTLFKEADKIKIIYNQISTVNTSGEDYHPKAVAMAYILENMNAGISLAKVDNNGNLKKINVILEEITNSDGTKGKRAKVSKCP